MNAACVCISAIGALLVTGGCVHDGGGDDGGRASDASDAGGVMCGARPAASVWAAWKMPNPVAANMPNPASYTDLGDGTVRDNVTCLVWQREVSSQTYSWPDAKEYCDGLPLAGGGWRLPSRIELVSLVDFTKPLPGPTIDTEAFPGTPSEVFWSSSLVSETADGTPFAWYVYFSGGATANYELFARSRVRCVR